MPAAFPPAIQSSRKQAARSARARALHQRTHAKLERGTLPVLRRFFRELSAQIIARLNRGGTSVIAVTDLFNPDQHREQFNAAMLPRWNAAIWTGIQFESDWINSGEFGRQSVLQIALADAPPETPPPSIRVDPTEDQLRKVREFLEQRAVGVWEQVGRSTQVYLERTIRKGIAEGLTFDQMQDRIKERMKSLADWQARRIARTETTGAIGNGGQIERDEAGIEFKEWVSRLDERTRTYARGAADHLSANRQVVANSEPFIVSGEQLMFAGDPAGSAANIINCRCGSVASLGKRRR